MRCAVARRRLQHIQTQAHQPPALDHAPASRLASDEAELLQRADDTVRGRLRHVQRGGGFPDRQWALSRGHPLQDAPRVLYRTQAPWGPPEVTMKSLPAKLMRARSESLRCL